MCRAARVFGLELEFPHGAGIGGLAPDIEIVTFIAARNPCTSVRARFVNCVVGGDVLDGAADYPQA